MRTELVSIPTDTVPAWRAIVGGATSWEGLDLALPFAVQHERLVQRCMGVYV